MGDLALKKIEKSSKLELEKAVQSFKDLGWEVIGAAFDAEAEGYVAWIRKRMDHQFTSEDLAKAQDAYEVD